MPSWRRRVKSGYSCLRIERGLRGVRDEGCPVEETRAGDVYNWGIARAEVLV